MTEHKTDMTITTYKKLLITEHKTDLNITKLEKYKKTWTAKYQRINTQPIKKKNNQIHSQIKIHNEHLNNITKVGKYKNWIWRNSKQTCTLLKLTNRKKVNSNSMTEHQTHEHYWKTEQHFDEGTLNKTQLHFDESNNKHTGMFVSCFDKVEWVYDPYKGFINKLYTCLLLLNWS